MKQDVISSSFRFLTPAFVHGVYQGQTENTPELRAPSIRGHLRWWWRTLGYGSGNDLFGSASGRSGTGSRVQVRLIGPLQQTIERGHLFLAHKNQGTKNALGPEKDLFTVELRSVRGGFGKEQIEKLQGALQAWLLMGAVGQRSGRCCGSVWPENNPPATLEDYLSETRRLLSQSRASIAVLDQAFDGEDETRKMGGRFLRHDERRQPVPGRVFGSARPRKSSSLKLRTVYLNNDYRIAALWCPKDSGDTPANLSAALRAMSNFPAKQELARLIENSLPDLVS